MILGYLYRGPLLFTIIVCVTRIYLAFRIPLANTVVRLITRRCKNIRFLAAKNQKKGDHDPRTLSEKSSSTAT
jgi:hypothetical protein